MLDLNKCIPRELDDDMECKIVQFFNHTKNPCEQCKANAKENNEPMQGTETGKWIKETKFKEVN